MEFIFLILINNNYFSDLVLYILIKLKVKILKQNLGQIQVHIRLLTHEFKSK